MRCSVPPANSCFARRARPSGSLSALSMPSRVHAPSRVRATCVSTWPSAVPGSTPGVSGGHTSHAGSACNSGITPARTSDDFPLPDGPTTRVRPAPAGPAGARSRSMSLRLSSSRPKKTWAMPVSKGRSPGYGGSSRVHRPLTSQRRMPATICSRSASRPSGSSESPASSSTTSPSGSIVPVNGHGGSGASPAPVRSTNTPTPAHAAIPATAMHRDEAAKRGETMQNKRSAWCTASTPVSASLTPGPLASRSLWNSTVCLSAESHRPTRSARSASLRAKLRRTCAMYDNPPNQRTPG